MRISLPKKFFDLRRDGVTQTFLMEFAACRRRAELSYLQGYSSDYSSNALTFGSLFHGALEHVYNHWKKEDVPRTSWLMDVVDLGLEKHRDQVDKERYWTDEDEQNAQLNKGYMAALLPQYFKVNWPNDAQRKWIRNETVFKNSYQDRIFFTGKFDRIAENKHGETWIFETKTKSRIEPSLQDRLSFDFQANFYILNYLLETNVFAHGFVYDVIQRPAIRIGKKESMDAFMKRLDLLARRNQREFFQRITVTRTPEEFKFWVKNDLDPLVDEFLQWQQGKLETYRNPSACETRYGACKFIKVCGLNQFYGLHKRPILFPELVEGA